MEAHNQSEQPEKNILVVDDDEGIRETLQMAFALEGYSVTTAANGKEALEILAKPSAHYGLILLDLMMPVMNGWDFIEEVKKHDYSKIPIILMTAYSDRVKNIDIVKEVVPKPMNFDVLVQKVQANYKT